MEVEEKRKLFKRGFIAKVYQPVLDIVLPPTDQNEQNQTFWKNVTFLDEPCCDRCGYPFEYNMTTSKTQVQLCEPCRKDPPAFDRARSAIQYHENSSGLVLSFKHGGRTRNLNAFARQMVRAGRRFWEEADILIPVPLHPSRLQKRKFNQSALLARKIARFSHLPFDPDILHRHKATASQGSQTARGRHRNVQGAFSVPDKKQALIKGKTIVLVDDVYTTGATLEACARTLRRAGADQIFALTLARVVKDQEIPT